ncbi:MAG: helix-turn-helix domain-containing protein [Eubacterium sp.]|nr:helix-turn-helix domain-containing protein [Eubacterium sp.]
MMIGKNIKRIRQNKGMTQEQVGEVIGVSGQAVSKWENGSALPDIQILPKLAEHFGISIDELMGYKLNALTRKEQFVKFMLGNGILQLGEFELKNWKQKNYYLDAEKFTTNAQIAKIGEFFADCIKENDIDYDVVLGLAYHGIAFSTATACALFQKYGITSDFCFDRKVPDRKGRKICGHTLNDGEKVIIVDDLITTGKSICERIELLKEEAEIEVVAVVVIANLENEEIIKNGLGAKMIEEQWGAKVYSIITDKDINDYINR